MARTAAEASGRWIAKLEQRESFVRFVGDAAEFYQRINSPDEVVGLWEQLSDIADNN